jgi:hypothetical protein
MQDKERSKHGEWENHPTSDLVEGSIHIFQGVVAEAVDCKRYEDRAGCVIQ